MKWIGQHIYDLAARFRGDVTIEGDLTVNGTYTQIDTDVTTTEQWLVTNDGTGPAAIINQKGSQDIFDVQDDGTSVFYIEDGGNVGIGTTSPAYTLDVAGVINTNSNYRQGGVKILGRESSNTVLEAGGDNDIIFETNNSEKVRVLSNGNVGIGTSSPDDVLHVLKDQGGVASALKLENKAGANNTGFDIDFQLASSGLSAKIGAIRTNSPGAGDTDMFFSTSTNGTTATEAMRITHDGNVGIGTTSPGYKLHVAGGGLQTTTATGNKIAYYNGDSINTYSSSGYSINNFTGNLTIKNSADDGDVIFQSDDGSGGVENYIQIDGSEGRTLFNKHLRVNDDVELQVGGSNDLRLYHDGSNSQIFNYTGNLEIKNHSNDADIILQCDDGSGGITPYLTLDGSLGYTIASKQIRFSDGVNLYFGNSNDVAVKHDGTDFSITNNTGDFYIKNTTDDKDIIFQSDDGSGGVETYFKLDGSASGGYPYTIFPDNSRLAIGNSIDLQFFHDGTDSWVDNTTGDLHIRQSVNDKDIVLMSDDGSGGVTAYLTLDGSAGYTTAQKNIQFVDNAQAYFGTGVDLRIYHDGSNSYIKQAGTGDLYIQQTVDDKDIIFQSDDGAGGTAVYFSLDGSAATHDGSATTALYTNWPDKSRISLGASHDLRFYHDATTSRVENHTGNLDFTNYADDGDIIFQSDDGSGGVTAYLTLDGGLGWTVASKNIQFSDSIKASFGSSVDMIIQHNGTNSYIENATGNLEIINGQDDGDIIFKSDDGSGGLAEYFRLDGSDSAPLTRFPDNSILLFGSGNDFKIYHDGSNSYLAQQGTGNLYIDNNTNDQDIIFRCDDGSGGTTAYLTLDGSAGSVTLSKYLYFNGGYVIDSAHSLRLDSTSGQAVLISEADTTVASFRASATGITTTKLTLTGALDVGVDDTGHDVKFYGATSGRSMLWDESYDGLILSDNTKLQLGSSTGYGDLQLLHDGSNSYIQNGFGQLYINQNVNDGDIVLQCDDGSGGLTAYLTLDGSAGYTTAQKQIRFLDSVSAVFGTSGDFTITHDATDSTILNATGDFVLTNQSFSGDLIIENQANDKDIIFKSDDGSGGVQTYFYLDGSQEFIVVNDNIQFCVGTGQDIRLYHDGSNSSFKNYTGNFSIEALSSSGDMILTQFGDDRDIIFKCDDGSGGTTAYLTLDGSAECTTVQKKIRFEDSIIASFGNGDDFYISHNGSYTSLMEQTSDLYISNSADDKDIIFRCDDGSGGLETYFFLDGSEGVVNFPDNKRLTFGTGRDLFLYHDGANAVFKNYVGDIVIQNEANDKDIRFKSDDGSGGIAEYFRVDGSSQITIFSKTTSHGDNVKALFGASSDLQIYHDGSNSYIKDGGTGNLRIAGQSVDILNPDANEFKARFKDNAEVELYYDNALKLSTTNTGIDVTGEVKGDSLDIDGNADISGDISSASWRGDVISTAYTAAKVTSIVAGNNVTVNNSGVGDVTVSALVPNVYGSIIKLIPSDFVSNDDGDNQKFGIGYVDDGGASTYGMRGANAATELYAFVSIPEGMKATHVDIYDLNDLAIEVYEVQINANTMTSKGTGNCNTTLDITDVNSSATNFLAIEVTTTDFTNDRVYGGIVTIAAI